VGRVCDAIKEAQPDRRARLLDALASCFAVTRIRLIDPQTLKVDAPSARRRASALLAPPKLTLAGRLAAAERRASAAAFDFTTDDVLGSLDHALLLHPRGVRLSSLPQTTALEALYAMHMLSAVEGEGRERFKAQRVGERADTVTFETQDLLFEHRARCLRYSK
jgi:hypothetical protein